MTEKFTLAMNKRIYSELNDAVLFVNNNGFIIWGNQAAYGLLNIDKSQRGLLLNDYFNIDLLEKPNKHLLVEQKNNKKSLVDVKRIKLDHRTFCLILKKVSLKDSTVGVKKHIGQLVRVSTEGLVMFNEDSIIDCDLEFASLFGYSQNELIGMDIGDLVEGVKKPFALVGKGDKGNEDNRESYELIGTKKTGETFHIELFDHPYDNHGNLMRIAIVKDISERVQHEKHLEYMAYYDELTDLPNRNYFIKVLEDAIAHAKDHDETFSVSFIDLDYFKEINETLGYDFGDRLLAACGEKLRTFKDTNTFIARMNGDKFLVLQRYIRSEERRVGKESRIECTLI